MPDALPPALWPSAATRSVSTAPAMGESACSLVSASRSRPAMSWSLSRYSSGRSRSSSSPATNASRIEARPRSGWSTAATTYPHEATAALCWLPNRRLPEKPWLWRTVGKGPSPLAGRPTQVSAGATSPDEGAREQRRRSSDRGCPPRSTSRARHPGSRRRGRRGRRRRPGARRPAGGRSGRRRTGRGRRSPAGSASEAGAKVAGARSSSGPVVAIITAAGGRQEGEEGEERGRKSSTHEGMA